MTRATFEAGDRVTWWPAGARDNEHHEVEVLGCTDHYVVILQKTPGGGRELHVAPYTLGRQLQLFDEEAVTP